MKSQFSATARSARESHRLIRSRSPLASSGQVQQPSTRIFMLDTYGKDEKGDLSASEKKALSKLVTGLKRQAKPAAARSRGKK